MRKRTHVREYYRRHHGTSDAGGSVTDHDRGYEAGEEMKEAIGMAKAPVVSLSESKPLTESEPFRTGGDYWSLEVKDDGRVRYTLGNLSDAGWFWNGEQDQTMGFLIRIANSKVTDEFLEAMKAEGITFNHFKPLAEAALKDNDGFYQLSGDNSLWHFGNYEVDEMPYQDDLIEKGFTPEEAKTVIDEAYMTFTYDYEGFEEKYGDEYKQGMKKIIDSSDSFADFFGKIQDKDWKYQWAENVFYYIDGNFATAVLEAKNKLYPNR